MDLNRNIFFDNDKVVENSTVKLSYCGKLFQNDADEIYIHYGFGLLWSDVSEKKMTKTDIGCEIELDIPFTDSFNCCFRDNHSNWDNNEGHNYTFNVEKNELIIARKNDILPTQKKLRKSYIWGKKLKLLFYKIITYTPQILNGTYKKKIKNISNINGNKNDTVIAQ